MRHVLLNIVDMLRRLRSGQAGLVRGVLTKVRVAPMLVLQAVQLRVISGGDGEDQLPKGGWIMRA